ncbi:MAG: dihydroorotate dehydrogenase (quinone) [Salinisphaeraceae bacterium]|nr:dihydroorotate dehydrogenase (quinone) [Salinisphaeraceae bacterium]
MYPLVRPLLFTLDPETAHHVTLSGLQRAAGPTRELFGRRVPDDPRRVMGLDFPNPVGLAAGLDKNGECIDGMAALGFGFLEIGTVTPRPQPGNPRPRLFRLPREQALINRMGFNNAGLSALLDNCRNSGYQGILGINIGKNFDTPLERAVDDYLAGLDAVYDRARYITVNISSPNTQGLRELQTQAHLAALLSPLKRRQHELADKTGRYKPLVVKVAPDLDESQARAMAQALLSLDLDAVIVGNTTVSRSAVAGHPLAKETGGLSGAPLRPLTLETLRVFADALEQRMPIIGVGGVTRGEHAAALMNAGADLVQIYTGLIYRGPRLVQESVQAIRRRSA